jgi:DNA-binding transcriptional regulator YdaS (Cro superfamily)
VTKVKEIFQEVIDIVGSQAALARGLGISRQAVSRALNIYGRVPWEWVERIEKITGIPREKLRPDFFPKEKE